MANESDDALTGLADAWAAAESARKDRAAAVSQWRKATARIAALEAEVRAATERAQAAEQVLRLFAELDDGDEPYWWNERPAAAQRARAALAEQEGKEPAP